VTNPKTAAGWVRRPLPPVYAALNELGAEDPWRYTKDVADGRLQVLVSPNPDGYHMSIAHLAIDEAGDPSPGRNPSWEEIREARYLFCPPASTMAMLLPPKAEYVNFHETTFHLWEVPELADRTDRAAAAESEGS
jgi:hypothetical protein